MWLRWQEHKRFHAHLVRVYVLLGIINVDTLVRAYSMSNNTRSLIRTASPEISCNFFRDICGILRALSKWDFLRFWFIFNRFFNGFRWAIYWRDLGVLAILDQQPLNADVKKVDTRTRASFRAILVSVPCSFAISRIETVGEKRTKLSRPNQRIAINFWIPLSTRKCGTPLWPSRPGSVKHHGNQQHLDIKMWVITICIKISVECLHGIFTRIRQ